MKPARFRYLRPETLEEALAMLAEWGDDAAVLAGGQSLVPMLNLRMAQPAVLIDVNRIAGLDRIEIIGERLHVGARARHAEVLRSATVARAAPLLALALGNVAHEAVRNRGTFGGSLALADPAAEIPAVTVCLDGAILARSSTGERRIPAASFFEGVYTTALRPEELLVGVDFAPLGPDFRFCFREVSRRHGDFALAAIAFAGRIEAGRVGECRVVFAGVEESPRRLAAVEAALAGAAVSDEQAWRAAGDGLGAVLDPIEGAEYPAAYRLLLARNLLLETRRQLEEEAAR
ncbi:FAD binding domain-containing protein [Jiella avicenniae]|uniref:FAD binding domain-containing protein n=1 Tax=Jiella avicenniae TaxID=2907202 RepID=A0A9X1P0K6_9HYPH|nr:FAD binding domain-containing protein [Jiella avicenniae]MCE7027138.1 FAD binding domain-containing protein [Jiella avicenniae]